MIRRSGCEVISQSLLGRFWGRVVKTETCWLFDSSKVVGYGQLAEHRKGARRVHWLAHRLSYVIHYGAIPDALWVLHRCDVRACVRPGHLFLGTPKANTADMIAKGRRASSPRLAGEANPFARLTWAEVRAIRLRARSGVAVGKIRAEFGIADTTARDIIAGRRWRECS
jgi:hypothetical protein